MKNPSFTIGWRRIAIACLLALACLTGVTKAEVVYENTLGATNYFLFTREYGDDINLAGTSRYVNQISILYGAVLPAGTQSTAQYRIRFYANNGQLSNPSIATSQRPGTLLWTSELLPVVAQPPNATLATISVPNILVPDRFTWTVEFLNIPQGSQNGAGLVVANPVSIGALLPGRFSPVVGSYGDFWVRQVAGNDDSWALNTIGNSPVNFYIQVNAVPEPAVVALGALGATALLWQARRRRNALTR